MNRFLVSARLTHDEEFLHRCLLALYEQQEADEQGARSTWHNNGAGFNKADGPILSNYAERLLSGHPLSADEHRDAADRLTKYTNQLLSILPPEELE